MAGSLVLAGCGATRSNPPMQPPMPPPEESPPPEDGVEEPPPYVGVPDPGDDPSIDGHQGEHPPMPAPDEAHIIAPMPPPEDESSR